MQEKNTTDYEQESSRILDLIFDQNNLKSGDEAYDITELLKHLEEWTQVFWRSRELLTIAVPMMLRRAESSPVARAIALTLMQQHQPTTKRIKRSNKGLRLVTPRRIQRPIVTASE